LFLWPALKQGSCLSCPAAFLELVTLEPQNDNSERANGDKAIEPSVYRYEVMCQVQKLDEIQLVSAAHVITANSLNFC